MEEPNEPAVQIGDRKTERIWETLRFEGNKIHCSPRDQSLSDLSYSKTKQKQMLTNMLRFQ